MGHKKSRFLTVSKMQDIGISDLMRHVHTCFHSANFETILLNKLNCCKSCQAIWKPLHKFVSIYGKREKHKNQFTYWQHVVNFYPCEDLSSYKKVSEGKVHCRTMVIDGTTEYNTMWSLNKFVNEILSVGDVSLKFSYNEPHQLAMFISQKFDSQIF